jgi:hypothetical protein
MTDPIVKRWVYAILAIVALAYAIGAGGVWQMAGMVTPC